MIRISLPIDFCQELSDSELRWFFRYGRQNLAELRSEIDQLQESGIDEISLPQPRITRRVIVIRSGAKA